MAKKSPRKPKKLTYREIQLPKNYLKRFPKDILSKIPSELLTTVSLERAILTRWIDLNYLLAKLITAKIVNAVNNGAATQGKTTNSTAMQDWANRLVLHVYGVLNAGTANWAASEVTVLKVAKTMGGIAGGLAGTVSEAKELQLKAAFLASKSHADCLTGGIGGGNWCTFDWF